MWKKYNKLDSVNEILKMVTVGCNGCIVSHTYCGNHMSLLYDQVVHAFYVKKKLSTEISQFLYDTTDAICQF